MARNLTEDEIENLLNFIKPNKSIPYESAFALSNLLKDRFRNQLVSQKIYPSLIPELKKQLETNYRNSLIQPGESVGILAAMSIGEKNTQSTLNSIDWAEKIIYSKNNNIIVEPIGKMIDNLLIKFKNNIENIEENRTEYLNLLEDKYFIPSCDENGNTNWYKIEAITKHLPVGKLVKVVTKSGRTVLATQSKSFLVWNTDEQKFLPTSGSDIKIGDLLPTTHYLPRLNIKTQTHFEYNDTKIILDEDLGFLIGIYLTGNYENHILDEKIKYRIDKLKDFYKIDINDFLDEITNSGTGIPYFSYNSSTEYINSLLSGIFINYFYNDNGLIMYTSYYEDIIYGILFLLNYHGIFGNFIKAEDNIVYKLEITKDGIETLEKILKNNSICTERKFDIYFDEVISINYVTGTTEYVYDLTVKNTRNFQLFNGLNVRDTFHKAGQSEKQVTVGVPRFNELLNATTKPKMVNCKIFFKEDNRTVQDLRENIGSKLVCLTLKDLAVEIKVIMNKKDESWYDLFKIVYNDKFSEYKDCLSIKLNSEIMYKYRINIQDIVNVIEEEYDDLHCVFSPIENAQLDIFVDVSNIQFSEEKLLFINPENANEIYIEECVQNILEKMVICGIPGIENIYYTNYIENGETIWYVETDGSNFPKLLGNSIIEMEKLQSNNVWDIFATLGIEAAREFLIQEFVSIMEGINLCHVKLLVDKMTYSGTISSISRYTLRKDESGPFSKASFEESMENFIKSSFQCDVEKTRGVSASIICGKRAKCGTGFMDLKIDLKKLAHTIPIVKDEIKEYKVLPKIKPHPVNL